jgi:hypothetical protein
MAVRSYADRAVLPSKALLEEVGDMVVLTSKTLVAALRPPYPFGGELTSRVGGQVHHVRRDRGDRVLLATSRGGAWAR